MREAAIIDLLRSAAGNRAARGLADDAAVWSPPIGRDLVLTHDTIAAGVHYLPDDDPSDIAWKLVAVNLSDLAAKGASPRGVLLGLTLSDEDAAWCERFVSGLRRVLGDHQVDLWGGDTVRASATVLGCTAIGDVQPGQALSRSGGQPGDLLFVSGTIGDAALGLAAQRGAVPADKYLQRRYRLPFARLQLGQGLFGAGAAAAMDVSDGLLIDASRLADASAVQVRLDLAAIPLSPEARGRLPGGDEGALAAATAGDDYELLFTAPECARPDLEALAQRARTPITCIGSVAAGSGLTVIGTGGQILTPDRLGYEH
ncbi:MAG: thiamine-phosphate kinase [Pacificimonas sp.]|jgi:thiamine-monophosphate kinase|nr:thiamine-phosphate kinase [Pacificimonas sp.]